MLPAEGGEADGGEQVGTLEPHIETYIRARVRRGEVAPNTAKNQRFQLLDFAHSFGRRPLTQLGPRAIERWIESMDRRRLAKSTQASRLAQVRLFSRWCVREKIAAQDFTVGAPRIRRPRTRARDVSGQHFRSLLAAARDDRDRVILWLMFGCGLRCVEVHRLNVDDFEQCTVFLTGKAGHQRIVPTVPDVDRAIERYLATAGHSSGPLVRTAEGDRRLSSRRISRLVAELMWATGIKIHPHDGRSAHGLRAAAASELANTSQDLRIVQEFLGHADLSSLGPYVRQAGLERLRRAQMERDLAA